MCGIVGGMTLGKLPERQEKLRQESMIFLTTELLQLTQARGTDATGVSILFNDGYYYGLKMGISSPEFISRFGGKKEDFEGFLKLWRENDSPVKTYLGHCRKTSVGSAKDNANNHPIKVGNVIGIHNGTLTNHDVIFNKLNCKRDGDVDSEAIIRLLHHYTNKGAEPFTTDMLSEVCKRLSGTYSVIAYNGDNPNQVVTFRDGKPNVVALIKPLNLLLMSSDDNYIKQALYRFNKFGKLYPARMKFPMIKRTDIEIKTMADDTCAVFTLSEKLEKDTSIEDLMETSKVYRTDKIWKKATSNYNANRNVNNRSNTNNVNKHLNGNKSTTDNKNDTNNSKTTDKKTDKEIKGKIWNKDLKEFKDVNDTQKKTSQNLRSVEIDAECKITYVDLDRDDIVDVTPEIIGDDDDKKVKLEEVSKEKVNNLVGNSAKIEDKPIKYTAPKKDNSIINPSTGKSVGEVKTVEVNTNVNPEAMEAAVKAAAVQPKYENDDEVLEELDVADKKKLEDLQLFALTNRISKTLFKKSFYKGFVAGREKSEKMEKAEDMIKSLKGVCKILFRALGMSSHNEYFRKKYLKDAFKEEDKIKLTIDNINKVFSSGDVRDNPDIKYLQDVCKE
jgi:amidophosphoribosyltransferase